MIDDVISVTRPRRLSYREVRARIGEPDEMIKRKKLDHLDSHARRFIAHSPFLAMATSDASGLPDSSPRGDYPGFVKVLDEHLLAIPDRPGNQLADSFRNLAENDGIGLMFVIPGMREVLRVNGRATPPTNRTCSSACRPRAGPPSSRSWSRSRRPSSTAGAR